MNQFSHIAEENLVNPFASCRPRVMNSPPASAMGPRPMGANMMGSAVANTQGGGPPGSAAANTPGMYGRPGSVGGMYGARPGSVGIGYTPVSQQPLSPVLSDRGAGEGGLSPYSDEASRASPQTIYNQPMMGDGTLQMQGGVPGMGMQQQGGGMQGGMGQHGGMGMQQQGQQMGGAVGPGGMPAQSPMMPGMSPPTRKKRKGRSARSERRQIGDLHYQIQACLSAINKSQMTIETLQYKLQQEGHAVDGGPPGQRRPSYDQDMGNQDLGIIGEGDELASASQLLRSEDIVPSPVRGGVGSGPGAGSGPGMGGNINKQAKIINPMTDHKRVFFKSRRDQLERCCLMELGKERFNGLFGAFKEAAVGNAGKHGIRDFLVELPETEKGFLSLFEQIAHIDVVVAG